LPSKPSLTLFICSTLLRKIANCDVEDVEEVVGITMTLMVNNTETIFYSSKESVHRRLVKTYDEREAVSANPRRRRMGFWITKL